MKPELLGILLRADDPEECESPADFDGVVEMARVQALRPRVEAIVGRPFAVDENVQDASFFTDLGTYEDEATAAGGILRHTLLAIRFSAFGRLFTVWSAPAGRPRVDPAVIPQIIRCMEESGYVHVDADALDEPYTGRNPHLQGVTWWIRYFDYL